MVRITKVTTRAGDRGYTTLAGGEKVSKSSLRIQAYGGVDELNSFLGLILAFLESHENLHDFKARILRIQNQLFDLGAQLAVLLEDRREDTPMVSDEQIAELESEIKEWNTDLPQLPSFLLPGGDVISACFHVARTVCRRVERDVVRLGEKEKLLGTELPYLNRLSDWLFVAARVVTRRLNQSERLWGRPYQDEKPE